MSCFTQIYCLATPRASGGGGGGGIWTEEEKNLALSRLDSLISKNPDHKIRVDSSGDVTINKNQEVALASDEL